MTIKFGPGTTISGFQHPGGGGGGGGGLTTPSTVTNDPFNSGGPSWSFNGSTDAYTTSADPLFVPTGAPWCVEGFFNQSDNNSFPRVFSIGSYPSTSIAISLEGGTMYYWLNSSVAATATKPNTLYWNHFAFASDGSSTELYLNGVLVTTYGGTIGDFTGGTLVIGNETSAGGANTAFGGFMNSFRWTAGNKVYTSNFTVPTAALATTQDSGANINAITSGQVKLLVP